MNDALIFKDFSAQGIALVNQEKAVINQEAPVLHTVKSFGHGSDTAKRLSSGAKS